MNENSRGMFAGRWVAGKSRQHRAQVCDRVVSMKHFTIAWAAILIGFVPLRSFAVVTAYDDAADPVYTAGSPYTTLNGGIGFAPGPHSLPAFPATSARPPPALCRHS